MKHALSFSSQDLSKVLQNNIRKCCCATPWLLDFDSFPLKIIPISAPLGSRPGWGSGQGPSAQERRPKKRERGQWIQWPSCTVVQGSVADKSTNTE